MAIKLGQHLAAAFQKHNGADASNPQIQELEELRRIELECAQLKEFVKYAKNQVNKKGLKEKATVRLAIAPENPVSKILGLESNMSAFRYSPAKPIWQHFMAWLSEKNLSLNIHPLNNGDAQNWNEFEFQPAS